MKISDFANLLVKGADTLKLYGYVVLRIFYAPLKYKEEGRTEITALVLYFFFKVRGGYYPYF